MANENSQEPEGVGYEICTGLISVLSNHLDACEATQDPWAARYRYETIIPFVNVMDDQIERLEDPAERETCREQFNQLIAKGQRIAPTIPVICEGCGDAFTGPPPEEEDEESERQAEEPQLCPACQEDREQAERETAEDDNQEEPAQDG